MGNEQLVPEIEQRDDHFVMLGAGQIACLIECLELERLFRRRGKPVDAIADVCNEFVLVVDLEQISAERDSLGDTQVCTQLFEARVF